MTTPHPEHESTTQADEHLLERVRSATQGEYDIYGELGRGGMATVFLAHELSLDRKVAIKVMSPAMIHGAGMAERFKREARTAAHLSHPNIIPVYAVREADGLLFFVMKLVEGTPLDAIIKELGKLPVPMVEAVLAQVGGAFGYAHRHGVVHRDIKPSYILIDDEGWAVVTDFGIAKVQETEGLTQTGMAVGTPTYMSPEQCGGGVITGASDQYALGVVAYEMLAGRAPFTSSGMMALMYSHYHEDVPPLELFRPDCPEQLRLAIMRMLEKEPEKRFASMEEAVAAMGARHLAHDDPTRSQLISLARTGVTHKIVSQVQTPRSPVPMTGRSSRTTPAPDVTPSGITRAAPSEHRWMLAALGVVVVAGVAIAALLLKPAGPTDTPLVVSPPTAPPATPPAAAPAAALPPTQPADSPASPARISPPPRNETRARPTPPSPAPTPPPPPPAAVTPAPAPSPSPAPAPAPPPPAPTPAPPPPPPPPPPAPAAPAVDDKAGVTAAILAYARALDQGDLAQVRRLFPGISVEQRQGLDAFWKAGGTMRTRWTVSEIVISGDTATARVEGTNSVTAPRERPSEQRVSWRARLERRGTEWRIISLAN
jgi:serine/threonine-protein kinase